MKHTFKNQWEKAFSIVMNKGNNKQQDKFRELCKQDKAFIHKEGMLWNKVIQSKELKKLLKEIRGVK